MIYNLKYRYVDSPRNLTRSINLTSFSYRVAFSRSVCVRARCQTRYGRYEVTRRGEKPAHTDTITSEIQNGRISGDSLGGCRPLGNTVSLSLSLSLPEAASLGALPSSILLPATEGKEMPPSKAKRCRTTVQIERMENVARFNLDQVIL